MLGSCVNFVGTTKEEIKVPIPCKLVGLHEALGKNFDWIVLKNPFDESEGFRSVVNQKNSTNANKKAKI
jgi:hypothetical protein